LAPHAADRGHASSAPYSGVENLEVMREAVRYNAFLTALVARAMPRSGRVLDFGAGVGTFALAMRERGCAPVCIEPDPVLAARLAGSGFEVHPDAAGVPPASVDGAYTLNVLEHIGNDQAALDALVSCLRPGAPLLVYVPAFEMLFSAMDVNVGHLRRYRRGELVDRVRLAGVKVQRAEYVDALGFFATIAYRVVGNREGHLDRGAVRLYDRWVFPLSRVADVACRHWFGKNLLVVGQRVP
jgi:SAM-dependent methyltransferase